MHAIKPRLSAGASSFEFLPTGANPRGDEKVRRFHGAADADLFLQQFAPAALSRELLLSLLGEERGFAQQRLADRELRGAVAGRLARDELRVAEVSGAATFRLFGGTAAFKLLRWPDEPRAGESVQRFHGAEDALRFLERLRSDAWSRRGVEDAARRATHASPTDDTGEVLRRFAGLLATGRAHLVRLPDPETRRVVALASNTAAAPPAAATALRPRFQLCDIPGVMDGLRWPVSAGLMRRWFQGDAYPMREAVRTGDVDPRKLLPEIIDENTVTMRWALGFDRVARTRWELLAGDWDTRNGRSRLAGLVALAWAANPRRGAWRFGDLGLPAKELETTCQVNFKAVGGMLDGFDDFKGSVGRGTLKLAVSGMVTNPSPRRLRIAVDELGVYLRDAYEFNDREDGGSQRLGSWSYEGVSVWPAGGTISVQMPYGGTRSAEFGQERTGTTYAVRNEHFGAYRRRHRKGGDFIIFSDVRRSRLPEPVVIDIGI
jgi:hypothetical protein